MELIEAIMSRTSAARLREPGPSAAHLEVMLAAADRAPDHGRLKPWRVQVLDQAARIRLGEAALAARRRRDPQAPEDALRMEREKYLRSPCLVVVGCVIRRDQPKVPEVEQLLAAGAAVQNLCLAAHALGYGAMWKTGPAAYEPEVKQAVGLAPQDHLVAILHLGTRDN